MSTSTDGGTDDASTRNCPDCGTAMSHEVITEDGTPQETTLYQGWWCPSCSRGMIYCGECDDLHHPDRICEPKRKARLEAAQEAFGGKATIPGHGTVDVDNCETIGEGTPVYIIDDGCPEDDCNGDLVIELVHNEDFAEQCPPDIEYEPICEYCSEFDHADDDACSHHLP